MPERNPSPKAVIISCVISAQEHQVLMDALKRHQAVLAKSVGDCAELPEHLPPLLDQLHGITRMIAIMRDHPPIPL